MGEISPNKKISIKTKIISKVMADLTVKSSMTAIQTGQSKTIGAVGKMRLDDRTKTKGGHTPFFSALHTFNAKGFSHAADDIPSSKIIN
jgi:hypothetical protein